MASQAVASAEVGRLHGPGDIRVDREPVAEVGPGDVLIRVTTVGLCGSDLHWFDQAGIGDARLERPLVPGHEFAGVILSGQRSGERVAVEPADPCGRCEQCRAGHPNVCTAPRFAGFGETDGALRTVMAWPERLLHPLPDGIGDDEAALLEPLGVALHALDLGGVAEGARVGVYGCGPLGLLLVGLLRHVGASVVVATDRLAHRVAAARAVGATHGFEVGESTAVEMAVGRRRARAEPVDVAFEVAGHDDALSDAIAAIRPRGRVVVVGIPDDDRTAFPAGMARRKELSLQLCRRMVPTDLPRAIALVGAGRIDLSSLITHRYALAEAAEAFATLASRRGLKVIVKPNPRVAAGAGR